MRIRLWSMYKFEKVATRIALEALVIDTPSAKQYRPAGCLGWTGCSLSDLSEAS